METIIYIFLSIFLISLISLVGVFTISLKEKTLSKILPLLIALSTGSLLGGFFIHILPELAEQSRENFSFTSLFILAGIIFFYFSEKLMHWHHHHTEKEKSNCKNCESHIKPVGYMILFSDGFHNFLDGIMIASAFFVDIHLGFATTILVILHEIPQEIGDFGVLLHAGFSRKKALLFNFLSALTALFGALLVVFFANAFENLSLYLTAIAGGGFLYIAMVDLIPEMHAHKHTKKTLSAELLFVILGIALMFGILFLEQWIKF